MPIAWFASEFQSRRWLRLVLGTTSILLCFGVAALVGALRMFEANAWFGMASKSLVDTTVSELEAGHQVRVLKSFKDLQEKYAPTYEHRARYDVLVEEAVKEMKSPDGKP